MKFIDNLRYFDGLGRGIPMMLEAMQDQIEFESIGELFRQPFDEAFNTITGVITPSH